MKAKTLAQAKNSMRRALDDLVDPPASEIGQVSLRKHFDGKCAYCEGDAGPRDGHIDHANPGSGNSLGNLLLACRGCNGDQKREKGWLEFLEVKCDRDPVTFSRRKNKIQAWLKANPIPPSQRPREVVEALKEAEESIQAFGRAFQNVRLKIVAARSKELKKAGQRS